MKKNNIFLFLGVLLVTFFSCTDNDPGKLNYVGFEANSLNVSVNKDSEYSHEITVYTNSISNSDRNFSLEVVSTSTANATTYELPASVTVPSGSNEGKISINFKDVDLVGGENLILRLLGSDGFYPGEDLNITINRICPFNSADWPGTYSVSEVFTGGSNSGVSLAAVWGEDYQIQINAHPSDPNKVILSNSGANIFLGTGGDVVITFDEDNSSISFDAGDPAIALWRFLGVTSTSYDQCNNVITVDGALAGPYRFTLTKM